MQTIERDQLILANTSFARGIANGFAKKCPKTILREDLESAAMTGLIEAAAAFDPTRCELFHGFAYFRINGAIRDELRRGDILPRRKRRLARKIAAIKARFAMPTSDAQVAAELGLSIAEYRAQSACLDISVELDANYDRVVTDAPSPYTNAARHQLLEQITRSSVRLSPRDAMLLGLHYRDDLTFKQIGARLGFSASRAYQLVERAVERLRGFVQMPSQQQEAS